MPFSNKAYIKKRERAFEKYSGEKNKFPYATICKKPSPPKIIQ
jgi:hypothetical protein